MRQLQSVMFLSILKRAVPVPKLTDLDNFLFVGPHPDDIEVACGGTVAALAKMGKKITILIVTDGRVGSNDPTITAEQLVEIRRNEAKESAKLMGVDDVRFLPYADGGDYSIEDVTKDVVKAMLDVKPAVVLCPDHTVPSECHPDHLKVGKAVTDAIFYSSWSRLTEGMGLSGAIRDVILAYYYTAKPNGYVGVTKTHKLHLQAMACHKTQFSADVLNMYKAYFSLRERRFGLRCGKVRAEGYRILTPTLRHCFPEASEY